MPGVGNPQALNRYSFVVNNPLKYTDPTGHRPTDGCQYEGCDITWAQENYDRERAYNLACEQGGGSYCSPVAQTIDQIPAIRTFGDILGLIYEPDKGKAIQKLGLQLLSNAANGLMAATLGGDLETSALSAQAIVGNTGSGYPSIATIEDGSIMTHSGWQARPGYAQTTSDVMEQAADMRFTFRPNKKDPVGSPGLFYASHAEVQLSVAAPDSPVGVSNFMSPDCQAYFSKVAQYRGVEQVVADPYYVRIFSPDGTFRVITR